MTRGRYIVGTPGNDAGEGRDIMFFEFSRVRCML